MNQTLNSLFRFFKKGNNGSNTSKTPETLLNEFLISLSEFKRTAYLPVVKTRPSDFNSLTKFGGLPYLTSEEDWSTCPTCKLKMTLYLQLDLNSLPENRFNSEYLIQYFYCDEHQKWESKTIKKIPTVFKSDDISVLTFPEKEIVSWDSRDDYPHYEEYIKLGISVDAYDEVWSLMEESNQGMPIHQDKLFGWPDWEQECRYPKDKDSQEDFKHLFQIVSNDQLDYMFGDDGVVNLFYNNEESLQLETEWACG